ncbi:MAG TPA: ABC transporter permease [Kofleriaceae bacterium]
MISAILSLAFFAQVLRIAVPYALAAMGGSITERSGVIDLAIESKLLFGAFFAAAVAHATGSAYAGIGGGMLAGAVVAAIQIWCCLRLGANQVLVGVALNLVALGGTRFLLQLIYHEGANSPPVAGFGNAVGTNPLVWLAIACAIALPVAIKRTRWGLRLRAAGDRPDALVSVGVSPTRARLAAALVGGAIAGAGGAQLSLSVGGFVADMSGGRGYIALAMVILSGWRPLYAALACAGIAVADAINIQLQVASIGIPHELAQLVAPALTLLVLIIGGGAHGRSPSALGKQ